MTTTKTTCESILTERIIKKMEETKLLPWEQPWKEVAPRSFSTKKQFNLINSMLLEHEGDYITSNKIKENGWTLKDNAVCEPVFQKYFKTFELKDKEGNPIQDEEGNNKTRNYFYMKYTYEYPIAYCLDKDGNEVKPSKGTTELVNYDCESIITNYFNRNKHIELDNSSSFKKAFHQGNELHARVCVPNKESFTSIEEYYSTLFHEMTHSTKFIMKREKASKKGDKKYAYEELVAELGAWILRGITGIETPKTEQNSAVYLNSWIKTLKDNPKYIYNAMAQAQKAVEYILEGYEEPTKEEPKEEKKEVEKTSFLTPTQRTGFKKLNTACMKSNLEVLHGFNKQEINGLNYNVMTDSYSMVATQCDISEIAHETTKDYPNVNKLLVHDFSNYVKVSVNELDIKELRQHAKYSPTGKHEKDAIYKLADNVHVCAKYLLTMIECMNYKNDNVTFYYHPNGMKPIYFLNSTNDIGLLCPIRKYEG